MNPWNVILFFAVGLLSVPQQSMRELAHEQGGRVANVIGVEFGYTDVPIVEFKPDRLIGHMRELPAAVESLALQQTSSKYLI